MFSYFSVYLCKFIYLVYLILRSFCLFLYIFVDFVGSRNFLFSFAFSLYFRKVYSINDFHDLSIGSKSLIG